MISEVVGLGCSIVNFLEVNIQALEMTTGAGNSTRTPVFFTALSLLGTRYINTPPPLE
jgi:hypothetical protein